MKRVLRYIKLYGFQRTFVKVLGRLRLNLPLWIILFFPNFNRIGKKVVIIGCGHHAYSSVAFYLSKYTKSDIIGVYDTNKHAAESLAKAYNSKFIPISEMLNSSEFLPDIAYICTNHASHTDIGRKFLEKGCDVFIEKPISVNNEQITQLSNFFKNNKCQKLYVGYNRPFSPAIKKIKKLTHNKSNPFILSSFIVGHHIKEDHWYRNEDEGTRVLSNLSHWIDLTVNMLYNKKSNLDFIDISITYSYEDDYDKNFNEPFVINLVSSNNDISTITFTGREEPYEGVNETINFQQDDVLAKIDDYRTMSVWRGDSFKKYRFWPKNNGHRSCIIQPFKANMRPWEESQLTAKLTIFIDGMVKNHEFHKKFSL